MIKTLFILLLTMGLAIPAFARMGMDEHMGGHGHGPEMCSMCAMDGSGEMMEGMMHNCLEHLDKMGLSPEQMNKVKPIHLEMEKKQIRFKADLRIAKIELRAIMEVKEFDIDKASAQVKKIEAIKTAHHLDMLKSMKEVRSILTDDQFMKMKSMMQMNMGGDAPHMMMKR